MCVCMYVIRQKRTKLWNDQSWILHDDNAPALTSMLVREVFTKNKTLIMPQPPYIPGLVLADFFIFPKLKKPMKGNRFATIKEMKEKSKQELLAIPKSTFQKCFMDWKKNAGTSLLYLKGGYFERGEDSYFT